MTAYHVAQHALAKGFETFITDPTGDFVAMEFGMGVLDESWFADQALPQGLLPRRAAVAALRRVEDAPGGAVAALRRVEDAPGGAGVGAAGWLMSCEQEAGEDSIIKNAEYARGYTEYGDIAIKHTTPEALLKGHVKPLIAASLLHLGDAASLSLFKQSCTYLSQRLAEGATSSELYCRRLLGLAASAKLVTSNRRRSRRR